MYFLPMTKGVSNVASSGFGPEPITGRLLHFVTRTRAALAFELQAITG
jgi:hypothetical protein